MPDIGLLLKVYSNLFNVDGFKGSKNMVTGLNLDPWTSR